MWWILAAADSVSLASDNSSCRSDLDQSGFVDPADIGVLLLDFGACIGCGSDLDGSGVVDTADIGMLLLDFGDCVPWFEVLEQTPDPAVIYDQSLRSAIVATGLPWRVRDIGTGIEMVLIPGGNFTMGCSPSNAHGCNSDEPQHEVTLTGAFYLGRTEVTQAQWSSKMGFNPSFLVAANGYPGSDQRPVERISWNDIQPFCVATGLRLPTEAQWEFAYRAGTTTAFHGSPANPSGSDDDTILGTISWFLDNNGAFGTLSYGSKPVGTKVANGFGLFDMSGNVYEWCQDWYGSYPSGPQVDPVGPAGGIYRVLRGGSWDKHAEYGRASYRFCNRPTTPGGYIGFRVARDP